MFMSALSMFRVLCVLASFQNAAALLAGVATGSVSVSPPAGLPTPSMAPSMRGGGGGPPGGGGGIPGGGGGGEQSSVVVAMSYPMHSTSPPMSSSGAGVNPPTWSPHNAQGGCVSPVNTPGSSGGSSQGDQAKDLQDAMYGNAVVYVSKGGGEYEGCKGRVWGGGVGV
jgi:hypothetical protein